MQNFTEYACKILPNMYAKCLPNMYAKCLPNMYAKFYQIYVCKILPNMYENVYRICRQNFPLLWVQDHIIKLNLTNFIFLPISYCLGPNNLIPIVLGVIYLS